MTHKTLPPTIRAIKDAADYFADPKEAIANGVELGKLGPQLDRAASAMVGLLAACRDAENVIRWAAQEATGRVRAEVVGGWIHHADKIRDAISKATLNPQETP